jgi:hypothetical protein
MRRDSPMKQMEQFIGTNLKIKLIKIRINKREQTIATCAYYMTTTSTIQTLPVLVIRDGNETGWAS